MWTQQNREINLTLLRALKLNSFHHCCCLDLSWTWTLDSVCGLGSGPDPESGPKRFPLYFSTNILFSLKGALCNFAVEGQTLLVYMETLLFCLEYSKVWH
ncbi:hypothetical protein NQD34_018375 [Periophthalmus magnuspinnatus]|nr:hypothetical protein NQD34_018375 [Periophthalmus magnuspinnatus]